ncbi:hypothetical protein BH10PSE13_BH10PSE13_20630 [soil metagenome]
MTLENQFSPRVNDEESISYLCDLSAKLHTSAQNYIQPVGDQSVLFAPDAPGLPVVVTQWMSDLLASFSGGSSVAELMMSGRFGDQSFDGIVNAVGFLEENGFLSREGNSTGFKPSREAYLDTPSSMSVWLHIINNCNLGCSYCFVEEMSQRRDLMTRPELEKAVRRIEKTAIDRNVQEITVKFAGGEPTLAAESMEYAYDYLAPRLADAGKRLQFAVLSNGTAITPRIIDFLHRPGVGIGISIDGIEHYHDAHRVFKNGRGGSWSKIAGNVDLLKREGVPPYIMATTTAESAPGLPMLVEWIFSNDLSTRLNVVRGHEDRDVDLATKQASYRELVTACIEGFEGVFDYVRRNHQRVDMARQLHVCELSFDYPLQGPACGIGRSHVVYDHKGFLTDCVMTMHAARTPATDDLLADVQQTVEHMPFDADSCAGQAGCHQCQWFSVCGGGCPTGNERTNGHPYTRSPICDFYKYVIPRYVEVLAENMLVREQHACMVCH